MLKTLKALLHYFLLAGLTALPLVAAGQALPVNMNLHGTLTRSSDGKVIPAIGDRLELINAATGVSEAALILDNPNEYIWTIGKPVTFNGTAVKFRLTHAGTAYKMLYSTGGEAMVVFTGSGFNAVFTELNLVAPNAAVAPPAPGTGTNTGTGTGTNTGTNTGTGTGTGASTSAGIDTNGDGKIDEDDIAYLKRAISGQIPVVKASMDVNGDGVVNTRDLVDLIRAVRSKSPTSSAATTGASAATAASPAVGTTGARIEAIRAERSSSRLNIQNLK